MNNRGKGNTVLIVVGLLIAAYFFVPGVKNSIGNWGSTGTTTPPPTPTAPNQATQCTQNPAITPVFTDKYTGGSVTVGLVQAKDSTTNTLLGPVTVSSGIMTPALTGGSKFTAIVNGTVAANGGPLAKILPEYTVQCGSQSLIGQVAVFQNQTIAVKSTNGFNAVGGTLGATGNDSISSTLTNNEIKLTGNPFKTSGKMFIIYEINTTTNVASTTLTLSGSSTPIPLVAVPNCYSNTLSGTPYRGAWEIPAVDNGALVVYNLQTAGQGSNKVAGRAVLTIYNEQDAFDSLTVAPLTSGICDSHNFAYAVGSSLTAGSPTAATLVGQENSWYFT